MISTLQFQKSVRESGTPFEKLASSLDGQHLMTVDPSCRRYWSRMKHAKVVHEASVFTGPLKRIILLSYLEKYKRFLSVVAHKKAEPGKSLQINTWDMKMKKTKEMLVETGKYKLCTIDANEKVLFLVGPDVLIFNIGAAPMLAGEPPPPPTIDAQESKDIVLTEYQRLLEPDIRISLSNPKAFEFIVPEVAVFMTATDCGVFMRLPDAPPPLPPNRFGSRGKKRPKTPEVTLEQMGPFQFKFIRIENPNFIERSGATMINLKIVYRKYGVYLVVAYSDGKIFIFCSQFLAETIDGIKKFDENVNRDSVAIMPTPSFVCSFDSYSCPVGTHFSTMELQISDSISSLRMAFTFEVFTMNRIGQVCHWGISARAAEATYGLLGTYSMGINREKEFKNADFTKSIVIPGADTTKKGVIDMLNRPEILLLLPGSDESPHRRIICSLCGQLCFLSVIQPQVALMKSPPLPKSQLELIGAITGATEAKDSFRSSRSISADNPAEILVLEKEGNNISAISSVDGSVLYNIAVQCPDDFVDQKEIFDRVIPAKGDTLGKHCPIAYNSKLIDEYRVQNTVMSCAVHSHMANSTVVGYNSGALCVFSAQTKIDATTNSLEERHSSLRYNTKGIHGTPVSALTLAPRNDNLAEYLISADESGTLVVWNLSPEILNSSKNCSWQSNAHTGRIISIQCLTVPCRSEESKKFEAEGRVVGPPPKFFDHKIIITACSAGIIKSWKLVDPGVLNVLGVVRTGGRPQLTSILAFAFLREPEVISSSPSVPELSPIPVTSKTGEVTKERPLSKDGNKDVAFDQEPIEERQVVYPYDHSERAVEWVVPKVISAGVDFNVVCVCGRSTGLVDSWVMSNDRGISSRDGCPVQVNQLHMAPIVSINQIPEIVSPEKAISSTLPAGSLSKALLTSRDGWQTSVLVDDIGVFSIVDQFCVGLSGTANSKGVKDVLIIPSGRIDNLDACVDCVIVREEGITKYVLQCLVIPRTWRTIFEAYAELHGSGTLSLKRTYVLKPQSTLNSSNNLDRADSNVSTSSSLADHVTSANCILEPFDDSPFVSRPTTGTWDHDKHLHDSLRLNDSVLPIPELSGEYTPDNSRLVSSPTESRIDMYSPTGYSPTGLLQGTLGSEIDGLRFGSPNHVRTQKEKDLINELQRSKKDLILSNVFRKTCTQKLNCEPTIPLDIAIDVISEHTKAVRSDVVNLALLVGIDNNDGLDYLKICKMVAIISYAQKKADGVSGSRKLKRSVNKPFKDMQKTRTVVSYNAMGERVVSKEKIVNLGYLADGVYRGFFSEIQKVWNQQPARVHSVRDLTSEEGQGSNALGESFPVIIKAIPKSFRGILEKRYTNLPNVWSPDLPHWFDAGRVVRIVRTIFDQRLMLQRDYLFTIKLSDDILSEDAIIPKLPTLQQLTVQYFERNYGAPMLNVSHCKAAHFLEACFQYSKIPVLDTFHRLLCPAETDFAFRESFIWFYVEARDFLYSSNYVFQSDNMSLNSMSLLDSISITSNSSMKNVHWERVKRKDARLCALEMFDNRGRFGPSVINTLESLVDALPVVDFSPVSNSEEDQYLDMEYFLDIMLNFLCKQLVDLDNAKETVLGLSCLPRKTISASSSKSMFNNHVTSMSHNEISDILNNLRRLCHSFMAGDPSRTGIISLSHFEKVVKVEGAQRLKIDSTRHFVSMLNSCKKQFFDSATNGIGYIDFIAVMIACVIQKHDAPMLEVEDFIEAAHTVTRGIEEHQVEALLHFLGHEQCPYPGNNPLWTLSWGNLTALKNRQFNDCKEKETATAADPFDWKKGSMTIGMEGNWYPGTHASSDGPGVITISKIIPAAAGMGEAALGVDGSMWKTNLNNTKSLEAPFYKDGGNFVPETKRELTTILGETTVKRPPKAPAAITPYDLTSSLSTSELQTLQSSLQLLAKNSSAPAIERSIESDAVDEVVSVDSNWIAGTVQTASKPNKVVRIPDVGPGSPQLSHQASPGRHRAISSATHEIMGTSTVFHELEGVSISSSDARISQDSKLSKDIIVRRPHLERETDSTLGRYTVQGRAQGPVIPVIKSEQDQSIDFFREEYRLEKYRKSRIQKIVATRQTAKQGKGCNGVDFSSLCDSDTESSMSLNGFESFSVIHSNSIYDMSIQRQNVIEEENAAALEMKAERDRFYALLKGKQLDLLRAKREAKAKERETNRMAAEQQLLKDERKRLRLLDEERRKQQEEDELLEREREEKERINAERKRRADQAAASRAAEMEMLERRQESDNLMLMRKEDQRSQSVEAEAKEKIRIALQKEAEEREMEAKKKLQLLAQEQERVEKARLDTANKEKLVAMKSEMENTKAMMKNDVNAHQIYAAIEALAQKQLQEAQKKQQAIEEERLKTASREKTPKDLYKEIDDEPLLNKKIKKFLKIMETTEDGTNNHPRRYENDQKGHNFFMPMTFGDDIRFNPFTSPNYDPHWFQEQMLEDREMRRGGGSYNEIDPTRDFSDITQMVEKIKQQQASDQLKMYSITDSAEAPESVTHVFRKNFVDWNEYMSRDKSIIEETRNVGVDLRSFSKDVIIQSDRSLNPIVDNDTQKVRVSRPIYRPIVEHTSSKLAVLYRAGNIGVTQLPLGHVVHDKLGKNCYRYYQVNHPSKDSILTVDLKCNSGEASVFFIWSPDKLPSISSFDEKADCNALNSYCCRISAIAPRPKSQNGQQKRPLAESDITAPLPSEENTYKPIIGIYSPDETTEFTLWAVASVNPRVLPKPIERVNRLIQEFNVLTSHDPSKLSDHFSVYRREAKNVINEEAILIEASRTEAQNQIARTLLEPIHDEKAPINDEKIGSFVSPKDSEISDELVAMERFISRAGRLAIGNALRNTILSVAQPSKSRQSYTEKAASGNFVAPQSFVDEQEDDDISYQTDGTPAHVAEQAFRGELDTNFPILNLRKGHLTTVEAPTNLKLLATSKQRKLRKDLLESPLPISYHIKNSKSEGFLKGSSKQEKFIS